MKTLKLVTIGLLCCAMNTALASNNNSSSEIDEAAGTPMLSASFSLSGSKTADPDWFDGYYHRVCQDLPSDSDVETGGLAAIMDQERASRDQIEVHCSEIIRVVQPVVTANDSGENTDANDVGCAKSVVVVDNCVPRPFGQQTLMSLAITCQNNPTETCIQLASQLDAVHPTIYKNKN